MRTAFAALVALFLCSCSSEQQPVSARKRTLPEQARRTDPPRRTTPASRTTQEPRRTEEPRKSAGQEHRDEEARKVEAERIRKAEEKRRFEEKERGADRKAALLEGLEGIRVREALAKLKAGAFDLARETPDAVEAIKSHISLFLFRPEVQKQFVDRSRDSGKDNRAIKNLGLQRTAREDVVRFRLQLVPHDRADLVYEVAEHVDRVGGLKNISRLAEPLRRVIREYPDVFVEP